MTVDEIRAALHRAAAVRPTRFHRDMTLQARVNAIEDYLNQTAVVRAELEEARLWAASALHDLTAKWDDIEGWQMFLRRGDRSTQDDIRHAKKTIEPELHDAIRDARFLVARLSEQIHRLELDDKNASRTFTVLTGS